MKQHESIAAATLSDLTSATLVDLTLLEHTHSKRPPRSIGTYDVLQKLGDLGGHADVFLAEKCSPLGIKKRAVIKRVPRWAPEFDIRRQMLLDEATVTACFAHPNLIALVDVGEDLHSAYLAVEHVEGTTLQRLNTTLRMRHAALPFELCCFVIAEALRGLHYAHNLSGPDGKGLNVVLRDRTPSNLLIGSTGNVKLTDFSLALTKTRRQNHTAAGAVKGKYAYLAPEYIAGEPCTIRSDIYALGVMLFELLAGRECFGGENAYDTLEQIVERGVVWRELQRENVPEKLMEIVARATNPCPGGRYESAMEMLEAVEEQMLRLGRAATSTIFARTMAKHELLARSSSETVDEKKYVPQLRVIRGESIVVRQAPSPQGSTPPPPPPISIVPLDETSQEFAERALNDAFTRPLDSTTDSELDIEVDLTADDGPDLELDILMPDPRKRPPILQRSRVIIRREKPEAPLVLIVAALLAIALFVAIVSYPT